MITSIQKIIKVGSSGAVTIPAKELRQQNLQFGDNVRVTVEAIKEPPQAQLMQEYKTFVSHYSETLKNLAKR